MTPPMKITAEVLAVGKAMMRTLAERHKLAAVMSLTPDDVDAMAIAALEALEQPTEGMLKAGADYYEDTAGTWQAMIRRALGRD